MKTTKFILAFDSGAKGTKYISECDDRYGCFDEMSAMRFNTKEDAETFNTEHEYLCWPVEIEVEN